MRYVNMILCLFMLLFIGVQYNDPDGLIWMLIYLVPAVWAGIAAFRPRWLTKALPNGLLILSIIAAIVGVFYFWPDTPQWWTKDIWYYVETAREGMGLMIVSIVLLISWLSGRTSSK